MRARFLVAALGMGAIGLLASCNISETLNVLNVKFSEGSPAVDGQTITYSPASSNLLHVPELADFKFKMVFHVKADNSGNRDKASFGSSYAKPVLNFRINTKSNDPISTTVEPFSVAGGEVGSLDFPIEIPITSIDHATLQKIIDGDPIPYFLGGKIKFDLFQGTSISGSGTSELDLTSGNISTRPSGSVISVLSGLL